MRQQSWTHAHFAHRRKHTSPTSPLLAVVDTAFAESPEGRAWLSTVREEKPLAVVTSSLPAARPTVEVKGRPGSDDQVVVLVVKREATGGLKERVVSHAHVTSSSFAFATFWLPGEGW